MITRTLPTISEAAVELEATTPLDAIRARGEEQGFDVDTSQVAFYDRDMNLAVESGPYELRVGRSANGIVDSVEFEVPSTKDASERSDVLLEDTNYARRVERDGGSGDFSRTEWDCDKPFTRSDGDRTVDELADVVDVDNDIIALAQGE